MHTGPSLLEPERLRKPFELPPELDMGLLKLDDLYLDLEVEVARLRASDKWPG